MIGFEHYYHFLDLVNNPKFDFISQNIDENKEIFYDGCKTTIRDAGSRETNLFLRSKSKFDKALTFFAISHSAIVLSLSFIFIILIGLTGFFSTHGYSDKILWFLIFGVIFLVPLLIGFYKLSLRIMKSTKFYKELSYKAFVLSNRMLDDEKIASSKEISDAIRELYDYFSKVYGYFDNRRQILKFFEKRVEMPLNYYDTFRKESTRYSLIRNSNNSIVETIVEIGVGLLGTILNIIKEQDIILPALDRIIVFMVISIVLMVSIAFLVFITDVYRKKEVDFYYYIYSHLFLERVTDDKEQSSYSFCFSLKGDNESLNIFKEHIFDIIRKERILAFKKDIDFHFDQDRTTVIINGVKKHNDKLIHLTNQQTFDAFIKALE